MHAAVLLAWPVLPVIALGMWWNSNTIAHNFIHRPFFRARWCNLLFSGFLSLLLGIPQTLWRERHLAHHAGRAWRPRVTARLATESGLVVALWIALAWRAPSLFASAYVPGLLLGLALCWLQGHYEHAHGVISHYGAVYNFLCFNDGYHAEHHANPGAHWSTLPNRADRSARASRWPAPLRWLDDISLEGLEKLALRLPRVRAFVLRSHRRALEKLLPQAPQADRVTIVGGGLFPRTALLLQELLPSARLTIVDADAQNLATARRMIGGVEFVHAHFRAGQSADCGLLVIPLSFQGDRAEIERNPPAPAVLLHDWIWRRRGHTAVVSSALLKRMNLIVR